MTDRIMQIIVTLFVWMLAGEVSAQQIPKHPNAGPLTITSETMTFKSRENRAVFDENVIVRKDDLMIAADHVEIFFYPRDPAGRVPRESKTVLPVTQLGDRAISKLRAWSRVRLEQRSRHAEAGEATYDRKEEKVILTGEPVLFEKDYRVAGTRITFFLKDDRSVVENSRVLIPSQKSAPPTR